MLIGEASDKVTLSVCLRCFAIFEQTILALPQNDFISSSYSRRFIAAAFRIDGIRTVVGNCASCMVLT